VFAYDIAWEPHLGFPDERRWWDGDWERWVVGRYGNAENAEREWRHPIPRFEDAVTGPSDEQLTKEGPWNSMVMDYRRFVNDLVEEKYGEAVKMIRCIDANHLIGARCGGATYGPGLDHVVPLDLWSTAEHLDFVSPEWGFPDLVGEESRRNGFHTIYAHCVGKGKPVIWVEFGYDTRSDSRRMQEQKSRYQDFYEMALESGANGVVAWCYPGGHRVDESGSDFGILDADGGFRPVCDVIKEYSAKFTQPRTRPSPDHWITLDRELYLWRYSKISDYGSREYLKALKSGRIPGLKMPGIE